MAIYANRYALPAPGTTGTMTVEEALAKRRSRREFKSETLTIHEVSQILWAAYGISEIRSNTALGGDKLYKTAPSAGATYPLEIYAVIGAVKDLSPGLYKYLSSDHSLVNIIDGDIRSALCKAALDQEMILECSFCLVYTAIYKRCTNRYGDRGRVRYIGMDTGHSAQNVYLQAEALHLGTCAVGAFNDEEVSKVLRLPANEVPLYIMPVGKY